MNRITFPIVGVELVDYHMGVLGDLNDNMKFVDTVQSLFRNAVKCERIEESLNLVTEIYYFDGMFHLYFTKHIEDEIWDGFVLQGNNVKKLLAVLTIVRGEHLQKETLEGLYKEVIESGFLNEVENQIKIENENQIENEI